MAILDAQPSLSLQKGSLQQRFFNEKLRFARYLDKTRFIYATYGLSDGISNASSVMKYAAEVSGQDMLPADRVHRWLLNPIWLVCAVIETLCLTIFSILGSYFSETDKNPIKRILARIWPYVRDAIKGGKNAYKAVRSILFIGIVLGAALSVSSLLLPLGLVFGICAMINRTWYRTMIYHRKKK